MGVDFLFACMGRGRYVSRYKMYTGVGRQAKRDARYGRLLKISRGEEVTQTEVLKNEGVSALVRFSSAAFPDLEFSREDLLESCLLFFRPGQLSARHVILC